MNDLDNADDDDDRLFAPCSCDACGHVTSWASTLISNLAIMRARGNARGPVTCEACGSATLRPGVTCRAPPMRQ